MKKNFQLSKSTKDYIAIVLVASIIGGTLGAYFWANGRGDNKS